MSVFHQLKGMLKSQFILIKRNKCLSFVEIFCPIFILLFYFLLRLSFTQKIEEYKEKYSDDFGDFEYLFQYSTNLTNKIISKDQIITSIDDLNENSPLNYTGFLYKCKVNKHIAIIGKDFPEKIIDKISSHFWEMDEEIDKSDIFKKFETIEEFDKYITSKEYGTKESPKICFGISKIGKFKYGIHYNTINVDKDEGNEVERYLLTESPHIPESKSNKNEKIKVQENLKFFEYYKSSGYLMVMKLISDYILQEITENPDAEINYSVIGMIYDMIISDPFHKYLYLLGFFIIISYSIIFSINIYREIHFRETKKKEYLKSMGVKERVFFLSSFIRSFIINIIHSLLGALILNIILIQSQYIYLALILFLFGLVIFSMTYFFQSFLQESRQGVIISLLCFCIMSFLYLPINSPEINKPIVNLFCVLFPPTNLLLGLNVFYTFEKEFVFFNYNIKMDVAQITIFQMILFFICSIFIYLFFGFIISQCFCYEYGFKRHCCSKKKKKLKHIRDIINIEPVKKEKDNDIISDVGDNYIDEEEQQHKPTEEYLKKSIKVMAYDLMNMPKNSDAYNTKVENLKKSFQEFDKTKSDNNYVINKDNCYIDELDTTFDDKKEKQKIRNKRRDIKNSMSNVKSNENFINNNLKISEIKNIIPNHESFMSKSLKDELSENSIIDAKLNENEFNKIKDETNTGARLIIDNLKKSYKKEIYVLDGLSCTFYENEIYGLLGENGAGKTTFISIISGLIEATDGVIIYKKDSKDNGADITTRSGNKLFRKTLGICPQNNSILFENLTVEENLEIFCLFKYEKNNNDKVSDLLEKFDLKEQRKTLVEDLSGGQKRKLCIAIACCGRSKVIILDEPTGGIDISSRKNIWNILQKIKYEGKIILLITHFMDEASFLADKIGILRNGKFIVSGTNRDLIDKYGKYITLKINKKMELENAKNIVSLITNKYCYTNINNKKKGKKDIEKNLINEDEKSSKKSSEDDRITNAEEEQNTTIISFKNEYKVQLETYKERIIIRIPTVIFNFSKSYELLKELEDEPHNITSYSIIKDQLEDVFINSINNNILENPIDYTLISRLNDNTYNDQGNHCLTKFKNDLILSFLKRIKDYKAIITEILFPVILILIACLVSYVEWLEDNKSNYIELNSFSNDTQTIFFEFQNISDFQQYYSILYSDASKEKEKLKNYNFKYLKNFGSKENYTLVQNIASYMKTVDIYSKNQSIDNNTACFYLISSDDSSHQYEFASIISSKKRHSPIAFTNYILSNIIKYEIKKSPEYKEFLENISIINYPFHLTYEEKSNKKSRNGLVLVFFVSIALSLIPSNFIMPIIREKENKSKHLQIISGLSIFTYWLNNYIFEIIKFFFISLFSLLILYLFNFYEKYLIILYALYGPALISFTYCVSYFINSEGQGQTIILLINLLFGALGGSATLILRTNKDLRNIGKIVSYFLRLVPTFCISYGYNELLSKKVLYAIDNFKLDIEDIEQFKKKYNDPENITDYIKDDFIYLSVEIIIYTGLLILLENKEYLIWKISSKYKKIKNVSQDEDIQGNIKKNGDDKEIGNKQTSKELIGNKNIKKENNLNNFTPLEVNNITKIYRSTIDLFNFCKIRKGRKVLEELAFKVENGECFGFIGANGAGKTTAFRCLCQEIKPDYGWIKINGIDISDYSSRNKYSIGYCPQFDTVFEHLTVEQNLEFYGKLKGIKECYLKKICIAIMKKLDLYQFRDYKCKNLSGGNKRKLSVGISIISHPNVIFMDEPSNGMDPYTRKLLLDVLHRGYLKGQNREKYNQKAVVLTTHSIEEIEALCDKIGILINGKICQKCKDAKGIINDIVQNNSEGVILNIEFNKPSSKYLEEKYGTSLLNETAFELEGIKKLLLFIKKKDYFDYIKSDSLGRDIYKFIKAKKCIKKSTILVWVTYINYLIDFAEKIKEYFDTVKCIDFKSNDFILKVKDRKIKNINGNKKGCESFIFGIIEGFKNKFSIEEYSYSLTSLESIFLKACESCYCKDKGGNILENKEKGKTSIDVNL